MFVASCANIINKKRTYLLAYKINNFNERKLIEPIVYNQTIYFIKFYQISLTYH